MEGHMLMRHIVAAVVVMGEPTFVAGEPYTAGSATNDGVSQILELQTLLA